MSTAVETLDRLAEFAFYRTMVWGGCTVDPRTLDEPTKGYAVADGSREKVVPVGPGLLDAVRRYVRQHATALSQDATYLGLWIDSDVVFLDVTQVFEDRYEALRLAESRRELAIYDLERKEEIRLDDVRAGVLV